MKLSLTPVSTSYFRRYSIVFFLLLCGHVVSQSGDQREIRSAIMKGNNVTVIAYNYGNLTRPNTMGNVADFVWRGLGHFFEFSPLVTAEVLDESGATIHVVDDGMYLMNQGGYSPDGTQKWGWLPRPGYARSGQLNLATSENPSSWPESWGRWPGAQGDGVVFGSAEAYYVADDFSNAKFRYFPFPSDTTKRGLGLRMTVRIYQLGSDLQDAVLVTYTYTNESPKPLTKMYAGFYTDPHIGGPANYADDRVGMIGAGGYANSAQWSQSRHTIFNWDDDNRGDGDRPTGILGLKLLETPGDAGLTSFAAFPYTQSVPYVPKNDTLVWGTLSRGIDTTGDLFKFPGDNVLYFGTGPFSLAPGDSASVTVALFCSESMTDLADDAVAMHYWSRWGNLASTPRSSGGNSALRVGLVTPAGKLTGDVPIEWRYSGTVAGVRLYLECSRDRGKTWKLLDPAVPADSVYTWRTTEFKDGTQYLLRAIAYHPANRSNVFVCVSETTLTVENPGNAQPELEILHPLPNDVITTSPYLITVRGNDADFTGLLLSVSYGFSAAGPFVPAAGAAIEGMGIVPLETGLLPNSTRFFLRLNLSDGMADTTLVVGPLTLATTTETADRTTFTHVAGNANPGLRVLIADRARIQAHEYEVTFDAADTAHKKITVKDLATGTVKIDGFAFNAVTSTPAFDGLKLQVFDIPTGINTAKSVFNRSVLNTSVRYPWPTNIVTATRLPLDWFVVFRDPDTTADGKYSNPGDTVKNVSSTSVQCPFRIFDLATGSPATYRVNDLNKNGRFDYAERIHLVQTGGTAITYQIEFQFPVGMYPRVGDTLWICTEKTITSADRFLFTPDTVGSTDVADPSIPSAVELHQNFPNPFNPTTEIQILNSQSQMVSLRVFDLLGREVAVLVNEQIPAGRYSVRWNASGYPSGVYFYRLKAGNFIETRKMVLAK